MLELSMAIDQTLRVAFIKKTHLFHGLNDEQLTSIASELGEIPCEAQKVVVREGEKADIFFLVYNGKVRVMCKQRGKDRQLAVLISGDYFGEEALMAHHRRSATVIVEENSLLLTLSRESFFKLVTQIPILKPNFAISFSSLRLARRLEFDWLHEDEVIYFLARKHPVFLSWALTNPMIAAILAILALFAAWWFGINALFWGACVCFGIILGWALWNAIDWGNDYYIVTNQRVIWLEKVIGLYDSRQEAPLTTIISVGVETDVVGRSLDYGNIIVRTYVGRIPFKHVQFPYQVAALVEEQWERMKASSHQLEKEAMKQALRSRLVPDQKIELPVLPSAPISEKPSLGIKWYRNLFKLRFENASTITYRKHWFVLIEKTWKPGLVWCLLIGGLVYEMTHKMIPIRNLLSPTGVGNLLVIWWLALIFTTLWWIYQYVDWSNDIFQVTPDQILDIDKTPFGREQRRAAPLNNILSTEYKRIGILGMIFNYGTVYITIGGSQMDFEDVLDPAAVQEDIDRRRMAAKQVDVNVERERVADWFAAYHDEFSQLPGEDSPPDPGKTSVQ